MGFLILFSTGTYAGIGTQCVESENIMKSTQTKNNLNPGTFPVVIGGVLVLVTMPIIYRQSPIFSLVTKKLL